MINSDKTKLVMLITGTSKGVGNYLANYYIDKGFTVIGCSRSECDISNKNYIHIIADLSSEKEILNIFKIIRKDFKRLDVLVNNAVVNPTDLNIALIPYKTIEHSFKVNVFAPILFCREALKIMSRNKFGRIINIGSMLTKHEIPGTSLYTTTKSALTPFTRILSKEVFSLGVTANVLSISAIKTDLSENVKGSILNDVLNRNAIKKYGDLSDVSNSIDYLIKEESNAVTGQTIYLGGV
tara:strand:+ start:13428 stop:14144 length:717 start_codon:yes stop_codon:yes gene_type:complete